MKEQEDGKKDLKVEENKRIARRILGILNRYNAADNDGPIEECCSPYPNETGVALCLVSEEAGAVLDGIFITVPPGLTSPVYCLHVEVFFSRPTDQVISLYGNLPAGVIGSDNKFYTIDNTYLFDSNGKAVKIEHVWDPQLQGESLEDYLDFMEYTPEEKGQLKKLDFVPTVGETVTELNPGDYEQVSSYLNKIDSKES